MKMELVPFNETLRNKIEALAAGAWVFTVAFGSSVSLVLCIWLLLTPLWWLMLLYSCWLYLDFDVCEKGGRSSKWLQNCAWIRYAKEYLSAQCAMVSGFQLDPKRNYLFCCFPHGVLPAGPYLSLVLENGDFYKRFPEFHLKQCTLKIFFYFPLMRELALAMGVISCSARSLQHALSEPEGGNVLLLYPGGAEESMYAEPGRYKCVVKKRKGFAKMALTCGAPLVPVVTFGETNLFDQVQGPNIQKFQYFVKKYLGFAPIFYLGRGLFLRNFGCIPRKTSLMTVVGKPIEVKKTENPTVEEIDNLHQRFMDELENLFEKHKFKYLNNPNDTFLELI